MPIYTKTGDNGETSLFNGKRVPKTNIAINLLGSIDELNAHLALVYSQINPQLQATLLDVIQNLFKLSANIAQANKYSDFELVKQVIVLEQLIDALDAKLPQLKNFIYPVGDSSIAYIHIARTVCRRVERELIEYQDTHTIHISYLHYLNRLSDFLFVLSRFIAKEHNIVEIPVEL